MVMPEEVGCNERNLTYHLHVMVDITSPSMRLSSAISIRRRFQSETNKVFAEETKAHRYESCGKVKH